MKHLFSIAAFVMFLASFSLAVADTSCATYTGPTSCTGDGACDWDNKKSKCHNKKSGGALTGCSWHRSEFYCEANKCQWDRLQTKCTEAGQATKPPDPCKPHSTQADCSADTACKWDTKKNKCKEAK